MYKLRDMETTTNNINPIVINTECSICLESLYNNDNSSNSSNSYSNSSNNKKNNKIVSINSCNHQFHQNCLLKWLEIKPTCPYCRENINGCFNVFIYKGNRMFPKKINLLLKADENNILFYLNNKTKSIYKNIPFSKFKKITLRNKKVFLVHCDKEQFYFNVKENRIAKIIFNIISNRYFEFKNIM